MKKFIILFVIAMSFVMHCMADSVDVNYADSAKITASKVYTDVKEAVTGLSKALKVGAEHVYVILVKQQVVKSFAYLILLSALTLLAFPLYKFGKWVYENGDEPGPLFYTLFVGGGWLIATIILYFNFTVPMLTGFINPEYGAIKDIVNFIK